MEDEGAVRQGNGVSVRRRRKKLVSSVGPLGDSVERPVGEQGLGTVGNGDRGGVGYKGECWPVEIVVGVPSWIRASVFCMYLSR